MVEVQPIAIGDGWAMGITVALPRTRLVVAAVPAGYIMCGALDVELLDRVLGERRIVAGRVLGVRSLQDLLEKPLESVTAEAAVLGLCPGQSGEEALRRLLGADPALIPGSPATRP